MLDRKIGNAAARIELEGGGEGRGGAGGKSARTASATLGVGRVGLQLQGRVDGAQEQQAAVGAADEIGVLALPVEPRRLGQRLLHHRRGIDEHLEIAAVRLGDQPARERLQALLDRVVIRSEEHTSELQSLMRISYAVFCLKKKKKTQKQKSYISNIPIKIQHGLQIIDILLN